MATRRNFIQVISAAVAALFIRGPVTASAEEEVEVKKLPMMPIRDNTSSHLSPLTGSSVSTDRSILNEEAFRRMISIERKRSERSRKPFVLMLLDMGDQPSERNRQALKKVARALSVTARETDLTGWYRNDCAVGVMSTEIDFAYRSATLSTMITRVSNTLRANLTAGEFNQVSISFHVFPEDWDNESSRGQYSGGY